MKKENILWVFLVLCIALMNSAELIGAGAKAITSPLAASTPDPRIDPVSGLPLSNGNSSLSSHSMTAIASTLWTKYAGNPVLNVGSRSSWESKRVGVPSVLFKDESFKLWYCGATGPYSRSGIGLATSQDGVNWTKSTDNPVLTAGPPGSWDSGYVHTPHVIFHDGIYKMWYRGTSHRSTSAGAGIGYATSTDGTNWVKHVSNPVLSVGSSGSWDDEHLWSAYVIVERSMYKMWYSACDGSNCRIGYATSSDGVNWTKYASNPILNISTTGDWDSKFVYYPNVIFNGCIYEMWYSGYGGSTFAIGYATSTDGINWSKHPNNPVITTGPIGSWDSDVVIASSTIAQVCTYKMWYTGCNASDVYRVGYATSLSPGRCLAINYTTGKPGSVFALIGSNFPPNGTATITLNGRTLTDTVAVDSSGDFVLLLDTTQADPGRYFVTAAINTGSATVGFLLDPGEPLRSQPIFSVPSGIALKVVYLPVVQK